LVFIGNGMKACNTVGAQTASGYSEHAYNFDVATRLAALLRSAGATVVMTRTTDGGVGPCISQRAAIANNAHADAAIAIHADGGPVIGRGFHVIRPALIPGLNDAVVAPSLRLALAIRAAYQHGTGMPYATYTASQGLIARSDLGGLNPSKVPAVFIETANMNNSLDASLITEASFRQRVAQALFTGLSNYLARG
jgi:N-acetylmuramoyl-L-alanine amidase